MPENIEATQTGASGDDSLESMFESQFAEDDAGNGHPDAANGANEGNQNGEATDPDLELPLGDETPEEEVELDADGNPIVEEVDPTVVTDATEVTLLIDGKEVKKTIGEIKVEAQKYEAANKRFEEAAEIRKRSEAVEQAANARGQQLSQVLQHYIKQSQEIMQETQPDWDRLARENPALYLQLERQHRAKQEKLQQAQNDYAMLQRQQQERDEVSAQTRVAEQVKLLQTSIPEWKDPVKAKEGAKEIDEYLAKEGIAPHMRAAIDSAEVILIVRKAIAYDRAIAKQKAARTANGSQSNVATPQPQRQAARQPRTVRPGAGTAPPTQSATTQRNRAQSEKAFKSDPSVDTLAGFFE